MSPLDRAVPVDLEIAVLAGGASRRMGRDKATVELGGRPLLRWVVDAVRPLGAPIRIVGGRPESFAALGRLVEPDLRPGLGALGGIHTALAAARAEAVLVLACDLPFVTARLCRGLVARLEGRDAVVPREAGRPVPVCAVYRTARCLPAVEAVLARGERKAASFLRDLDVRWVDDDELAALDPAGEALTNVNTPEELARAERRRGLTPP